MELLPWIGISLVNAIFWVWFLLFKGYLVLEGSWLAEIFVSASASSWSREALKFIGWIMFIVSSIYSILGIFIEGLRF